MPDTGAPWNIPYVEAADLVSDWPADSLALANAIDAGLDAAGGLVDVKSALFTGTQTNSTAGAANFAVTDLSITHEVADASNKLIISGFFGLSASSSNLATVGIAVYDGTGLIGVGDAAGSRTQLGAGAYNGGGDGSRSVAALSIQFVHTPGTGSKTYTLRAINIDSGTQTIYINRTSRDTNGAFDGRAASGFVIQEVKV